MPTENKKPAICSPAIGVGVLVWKNKQLLLGRRLHQDHGVCWQFPGGHLDRGESVTECARREVREETGLQIKQLRHLGFTEKPFEMNQKQYLTLFVSAEYESGEAKVLEPEKCDNWQWFDYVNLPDPLFTPIILFLEQNGILVKDSEPVNSDIKSLIATSYESLYSLHCAAEVVLSIDSK